MKRVVFPVLLAFCTISVLFALSGMLMGPESYAEYRQNVTLEQEGEWEPPERRNVVAGINMTETSAQNIPFLEQDEIIRSVEGSWLDNWMGNWGHSLVEFGYHHPIQTLLHFHGLGYVFLYYFIKKLDTFMERSW